MPDGPEELLPLEPADMHHNTINHTVQPRQLRPLCRRLGRRLGLIHKRYQICRTQAPDTRPQRRVGHQGSGPAITGQTQQGQGTACAQAVEMGHPPRIAQSLVDAVQGGQFVQIKLLAEMVMLIWRGRQQTDGGGHLARLAAKAGHDIQHLMAMAGQFAPQ